jgi:hypothetical protein
MPVLHCPRCQRANPEAAIFCYFDGAVLQDGVGAAAAMRLMQEFVFPSGRRCRTFDELAQGCQEEWNAARDLLRQGVFGQFFTTNGRADLFRASQEAQTQADPDIGLVRFLSALPISKAQAPKLDLSPRRVLLGNVMAGEARQVQLTISNQGQGMLQGALKVTEGGLWLKVAGGTNPAECLLRITRDQKITLQIDTRQMASAQTYVGKLTVITNGGVVEVPVRMDLMAHPFGRPPFQGAKTPREMAERMRTNPKAAVPLLESGEIGRWFAGNGWNYPVRGVPAGGVAGVQQYFEAMGLSRPPPVQVSPPEVRFACVYPENARFQIKLHTPSRKWVYANVDSDSPWLKVLKPQVWGPQQAAIDFEIASRSAPRGRAEGRLNIVANSGQTLSVRVHGEVRTKGSGQVGGILKAIVATALACLLLRLVLVPVVDVAARGKASRAAAIRVEQPPGKESPLNDLGGWLHLPWADILTGAEPAFPAEVINPGAPGQVDAATYRHYFDSYLVRHVVTLLWWVGALAGVGVMWQRGNGMRDLLWGLLAGIVAGVAVSATLACVLRAVEILPHVLWGQGGAPGPFMLLVWVVVVLAYWTGLGAALGLVLSLFGPVRRVTVVPLQNALARLFRICGAQGLADLLAPAT